MTAKVFVFVTSLLFAATTLTAQAPNESPSESKFMRVTRTAAGKPDKLQTSVVRYRNGEQTVDLIGAIHIADREYFEGLNQLFTGYDVLAYELAAPKGTRPEPQRGSSHPIGNMQTTMANVLGLSHQMEVVDYVSPQNFVHADIPLEEAMERRGETQMTMLLDFLRKMMVEQNKAKAAEARGEAPAVDPATAALQEVDLNSLLMMWLMNPEGFKVKVREIAAEIFSAQGLENGLGLASANGVIVDARNEACMEVVDAELAKSTVKSVGIFYGAAHNPDLEKRLIARGFKQEGDPRWVTAWDVQKRTPAAEAKRRENDPQREMIHQLIDRLLDEFGDGAGF